MAATVPRLFAYPSSLKLCFPPSAFRLRTSHWSAYEKNPEEQNRPTVESDHVIHPLSENYWAPHPQTGVFGPPTAHHIAAAVSNDTSAAAVSNDTSAAAVSNDTSAAAGGGKEGSVLDLKAWFRHNGLEDVDKPHFL